MFVITSKPDWSPGQGIIAQRATLEAAENWVTTELNSLAEDGCAAAYYITQMYMGSQLKYASEIDVVIKVTAYPEDEGQE